MKKTIAFATIAASVSLLSFVKPGQEDNTLSKKEKKEGWILLFDGKSTDGWHTYRNRESDAWMVAEGELRCKEEGVTKRSDLITNEKYENFELSIDWKISPKHNSGIIYRCTEENGAPYESGPEYQLIDDKGYPDPIKDKQYSGANYDMQAPSKDVVKPVGEWNRTRIVVKGAHVEHWLNGAKIVEYELWSPEWEKTKSQSKWRDVKPYGMAKAGHIDLQDHGGGVTFKNIKIRKL